MGATGTSKLLDTVEFLGDRNIRGTNSSTFEITTEKFLTLRGDCIIGIKANKGCLSLSDEVKRWLQRDGSRVLLRIVVDSEHFDVTAYGSPLLTHANPVSIVVRKSDYISDRTLAIKADASAKDLPRSIITNLQKGKKGKMEIYTLK